MSQLIVTEAATDLQLLTIEERRSLAGVTGSGSDAALDALGLRIASAICSECNVAIASGGEPPTLMRETLTETFYGVCTAPLMLSRRHAVTVTSVTVDGALLSASDYLVNGEGGSLDRLVGDSPAEWSGRKIVVAYQAGFQDVPADLAMAARDFFRLTSLEGSRDPSVKAQEVEVDGVERVRTEFWVGSLPGGSSEGPVPEIVAGQLKRFRNYTV